MMTDHDGPADPMVVNEIPCSTPDTRAFSAGSPAAAIESLSYSGHLHPITDDYNAVIGLLMVENDAMRIELGHEHLGQHREFNSHDLERGRSVGAHVTMLDANTLAVQLES